MEVKHMIKNADMPDAMVAEALQLAREALETHSIERDVAAHIKKEFDKRHEPTWHCIVGRNFGSYVSHETRRFIYFYCGHVAILLFKS